MLPQSNPPVIKKFPFLVISKKENYVKMLSQSGHLVMKKFSFFGNFQKRKLVDQLHSLKNNSNSKYVAYIIY